MTQLSKNLCRIIAIALLRDFQKNQRIFVRYPYLARKWQSEQDVIVERMTRALDAKYGQRITELAHPSKLQLRLIKGQ